MRYRFPDNFWWGSACSALQTEGDSLNGGKSQTTWDVWFERQPDRFHQASVQRKPQRSIATGSKTSRY